MCNEAHEAVLRGPGFCSNRNGTLATSGHLATALGALLWRLGAVGARGITMVLPLVP